MRCFKTSHIVWLVAFVFLPLSTAFAAVSIDNKGTEFIFSFLRNYDDTGSIEVHLTSENATTVTVEYPVGTVVQTVAVVPGSINTVALDVDAGYEFTLDAIQSNAVRLSAENEFLAYAINRREYTSGASVVLPVDALSQSYFLTTWDGGGPEFTVTAVEDNTTVTITPSNAITNRVADTPFTVTLNRGQVYWNADEVDAVGGLAGTRVAADKPISVSSGNVCANVPDATIDYCDHLFEIAQPVQTWGTYIPVVNVPDRPTGAYYRIIASEADTTILQDSASVGVIGAGDYLDVGPLPGNHIFSSEKPIYVSQFIPGAFQTGATTGDPSQGNMIPSSQYLNDYRFATVGGGQFATHHATVIANNADLATITLDGTPIGAGSFTAISGSDYSAAVLSLTEGTHRTQSTHGHGLTILGYNDDDSYLYAGGASFAIINPVDGVTAPSDATYVFWNGFFNQENVVELNNSGDTTATVTLTVVSKLGEQSAAQTLTLEPNQQRDVLVNELPGYAQDSYGTVKIESDGGEVQGRGTTYDGTLGAIVNYGFSLPLGETRTGESYTIYNTNDPIGQGNTITQWLTIVNADPDEAKTFTVERYNQTGTKIGESTVSVAPLGREDIEAGHVLPGSGAVGLNKIIPADATAGYVAVQNRYGVRSGSSQADSDYSFGNATFAQTGGAQETYAAISAGLPGATWVEVANVSPNSVSVSLEVYNDSGTLLSTLNGTITALSQEHFRVDSILGTGNSGQVRVISGAANAVFAQVVHYFYENGAANVQSSYAEPTRDSFSSTSVGSYNLFMGAYDWLRVKNLSATEQHAVIHFLNSSGTEVQYGIDLPANGGAEVDLHNSGRYPELATDTYGMLWVTSTADNTVLADVVRIKQNADGNVNWVVGTPLE